MRRLATLFLLVACGAPRPAPDAGPVLQRYPLVPNAGGAVLDGATLVAVTYSGDAHAASHRAFVQWLSDGGWLTARGGEYGVTHVSAGTPVELAAPAPSTLTDAQLTAQLAGDAHTLFVVFLPEGTSLTDRFGQKTCESNPGTGYHEATAGGVPYVAVPACPPRFSAVLDLEGSMHLDAARLALDALTNPHARDAPAYGLTDTTSSWKALGAEVGDFCFGRFVTLEGHTVQRAWSNAAVQRADEPCQPATDGPRFGLTVTPSVVQPMAVNVPLHFTVTGWSSAPQPDFRIDVTPWVGDFAIQPTLDAQTSNDGQSAQLTVNLPYAVPKGTFGAVLLRAIGAHETPLWPVGLVAQ